MANENDINYELYLVTEDGESYTLIKDNFGLFWDFENPYRLDIFDLINSIIIMRENNNV